MPTTLLHGTSIDALPAIMKEGLKPPLNEDNLGHVVSLTRYLAQARANAWKHGTDGVLLTVNVAGLELGNLGHYTYDGVIPPERILRARRIKKPA